MNNKGKHARVGTRRVYAKIVRVACASVTYLCNAHSGENNAEITKIESSFFLILHLAYK